MSLRITNGLCIRKNQQGMVFLVLIIVIALAFATYYFSSISIVQIQVNNIEKTRIVLKQAKAALIDYAITHADNNGNGLAGEFGYLPCPDKNGLIGAEGSQDPVCGARYVSNLGYLPWKSLDMPVLKDGSGSCLWYAVSGNYKGEPSSGLINEDTRGFFQLVDANANVFPDGVIAVIFAPGDTLTGQTRNNNVNSNCGGDYGNQVAYLEGNGVIDNANVPNVANSVDQFINATLTSNSEATPYNDHLVTITRDEIWRAIMRRTDINNRLAEVTESLAECLAEFVNHAENPNKRLPWPAKTDIEGGDYRITDNYSDELNAASGYAGRFPLHLDNSIAGIATIVNIDADYLDIPNAICSSLNLPVSGVANVDLTNQNLEHRIVLENWKDHFFYAASKHYSLPNSLWSPCGGSGDCVSVGGVEYAAVIFFSASPYPGLLQVRDVADKSLVSNYLENGNAAIFSDIGGNGAYSTTDPNPLVSNDIMFCLTDSATPAVVAC